MERDHSLSTTKELTSSTLRKRVGGTRGAIAQQDGRLCATRALYFSGVELITPMRAQSVLDDLGRPGLLPARDQDIQAGVKSRLELRRERVGGKSTMSLRVGGKRPPMSRAPGAPAERR